MMSVQIPTPVPTTRTELFQAIVASQLQIRRKVVQAVNE